jgi:hypothetical protein
VTVVAGTPGSGKSRLIAQLRGRCPPGERWALLSNSGGGDGLRAAGVSGRRTPVVEQEFSVGGGCACCVAGPAFRTTLVRLLRAGPWQRLYIEVDPAGHPHLLVDQLRTPPFDQHLTVVQLLMTLGRRDVRALATLPPAADASAEDPLGRSGSLGWASDFLLQADDASGAIGPADANGAANAIAARLQEAPPWPRLERRGEAGGQEPSQFELPALPGWRAFSALPLEPGAGSFDLFRQWPAHSIAQRRPFAAQLAALAEDPAVVGLQALMRTPRAWYRWRFGQGHGPAALAFDEGRHLVATETAWRLDSRVCVWLAAGADGHRVHARLQALDSALEDDAGDWSISAGI